MKQRRSLTHVGGEVERWGDPDASAALAEALDVAPAPEPRGHSDATTKAEPADDPDRAHVHGFHSYPARMHPSTAARLVRAVAGEGSTVLDPFCGSGTILVEAMLAGRRALGADLNPFAVRLASLKTSRPGEEQLRTWTAAARGVAAFADERRQRRAGATRRYGPDDVAAFNPHVLLELDSLRAAVVDLADEPARDALLLVLSAILVKVSRRASDTSDRSAPRRIAAGYPSRLFVKKADELTRRLAAFAALLPDRTPPARVAVDDAARLRTVGASTADGVVTSPPYVATYDYLAHHALRMRWLGLDPRPFGAGEIGSRRRYASLDPAQASETWARELSSFLRAMARACRQGARLALLLADSAVGDQALRADVALAAAAGPAGLDLVARASQRRPHFHGPTSRAFETAPRAEHAFALVKR